jgi:hypothetical protein
MSGKLAVVLLVAWVVLAATGLSSAQQPTTQPASEEPGPARPLPVLRPGVPDSHAEMMSEIAALRQEVNQLRLKMDQELGLRGTWTWACILAGAALIGVLWIVWSMRTLARNQIEVARMIQALGPQEPD